uniref:Chalcone-flavonone isomerase family protein n=1 Tax=Nemophila menziesii TaxID=79376 RepID=A0A292GF51_NEMME|nr:chalcone isomerase [Nemophila menziesii]
MSTLPSTTDIQIENYVFPATVKPPGSTNTLFLGGAGVRGLEINGNFVKFTAIAVYLEGNAVSELAIKWKGKSGSQLTDSDDFFSDIVTGSYEKFTQVTMILPLTGKIYSEKVAENCTAYCKTIGTYTDAESQAIEMFLEVFEDEIFPPGASILFTQSPNGSLTISFAKDGSIPEIGKAVIENKQLSEAVLISIIGKNGVSPQAKESLAARLSELLGQYDEDKIAKAKKATPLGQYDDDKFADAKKAKPETIVGGETISILKDESVAIA